MPEKTVKRIKSLILVVLLEMEKLERIPIKCHKKKKDRSHLTVIEGGKKD